MKNIVKNDELRLKVVEKRVKDLARYIIEDLVDEAIGKEKVWTLADTGIKLFKEWLKIYNNMRIMRGYVELDGSYFYWHCLK